LNIEDYIPHRKPMVLIDKLISSDDHTATASVSITPNSLFQNEQGNVPTWIGIEYMAQTIAAYAGAKHVRNKEVIKAGFLVGTRSYDALTDYFLQGKTYLVNANLLFLDEGLGSFECSIKEEATGLECCLAKINVYEPENIDNL
jgi:predicted hotdog family 3-hydroxylacyl-ACP dehydratase